MPEKDVNKEPDTPSAAKQNANATKHAGPVVTGAGIKGMTLGVTGAGIKAITPAVTGIGAMASAMDPEVAGKAVNRMGAAAGAALNAQACGSLISNSIAENFEKPYASSVDLAATKELSDPAIDNRVNVASVAHAEPLGEQLRIDEFVELEEEMLAEQRRSNEIQMEYNKQTRESNERAIKLQEEYNAQTRKSSNRALVVSIVCVAVAIFSALVTLFNTLHLF